MDFVTQRLERWLWSGPGHSNEGASRSLLVARYAFALLRDLLNGNLSLRAMSLVYTTILSIVPLLAFAFAVLKGLGFHRELEPLLLSFTAPLGPQGAELTQRLIGFVDNVSGSALASVSIAILLYSALSMAQKVEGSFNFVWRVDRPRSFWRRFSEYLSVMFVGPLLMTFAIGLTATLASATATSRLRDIEPLGTWIADLSSLAPYAMVVAGFSFLYVFVPNTRVRLIPALIGGLFAGVLWAGSGSLFTSFVVSVSRTEAIYSGFAIVIVAMLWMHLSWLILLLGAQLSFYVQNPEYLRLGQRTEHMSNALRERLALSAMLLVGRDFETPGHGWRIESLSAQIRVPRHWLEPIVSSLTNAGLLTRTNDQRLIPARDPRRIEVTDILSAVRRSERDSHGASDDWNDTVSALAEAVERAIRDAVAGRSLADMVDADACAEEAAKAMDAPVAAPPTTPRVASSR
ncbi:MAG TPA: YhjD/YihY/BrkB family envelope integrity protein [Vicinamibacterales bacterium]|nr:YhjD/YihY/BrkB family envelope integrity protein [Vicinamibacterales bacterium]